MSSAQDQIRQHLVDVRAAAAQQSFEESDWPDRALVMRLREGRDEIPVYRGAIERRTTWIWSGPTTLAGDARRVVVQDTGAMCTLSCRVAPLIAIRRGTDRTVHAPWRAWVVRDAVGHRWKVRSKESAFARVFTAALAQLPSDEVRGTVLEVGDGWLAAATDYSISGRGWNADAPFLLARTAWMLAAGIESAHGPPPPLAEREGLDGGPPG